MPDIGNTLLAAGAISFLIFIHELGHFVAARMFDVRVETFSLGFGPRIFGIRRGDTDYRLSLIPLGGYVKMAGEYGDGSPGGPRDLTSKPAWQRAIIFAGGVVVNFAFAFLIFPVVFAIGVPFVAPVVGDVVPAGAAWQAGIRSGDEIVEVSGRRTYDFSDIATEVTLGDPGDTTLTIVRDGRRMIVPLTPVRNEERGLYEIGISPANDLTIAVVPDHPAAAAGLKTGDRLTAINGHAIDKPSDVSRALVLAMLPEGPTLDIEYLRDGEPGRAVVEPEPATSDVRRLGALPVATRVVDVRAAEIDGDGAPLPLKTDDVVLSVDGVGVFSPEEFVHALASADTITVLRDESPVTLPASPGLLAALKADHVAFGRDGTRVRVLKGGGLEAAGLVSGDEILALDGTPLRTYDDLSPIVNAVPADSDVLRVRYRRDGKIASAYARVTPAIDYDYGFSLTGLEVLRKEDLPGAMRAGFDRSIASLRTTWLTLTKLLTGDVGSQNLGGIVSISVITYRFADIGWGKLLFFLGLLSINLGFINILPIPVLDGGQLVFLALEKLKGSELSERFLQNAQLVGLVAILGLVLYVTYRDIVRFF